MKKGIVVLSLFDGMSCGRIALDRAGIKVKKYYASEIDKYAQIVSAANYPDIIQLGDIIRWREWEIEQPDLIVGGSPCQGFSFAGKGLNFNDPRSKLFFTFVDILKYYKPKYFLLENVKMKKEYEKVISDLLGVLSIEINSALVSAQNRKRLYWTNIPNVTQPKDKGIVLRDIIEDSGEGVIKNQGDFTVKNDKSQCLDANYHKGPDNHGQRPGIRVTKDGYHQYRNDAKKSSIQGTHVTFPEGKTHCMSKAHSPKMAIKEEFYKARPARIYETKGPTLRKDRTGLEATNNGLTWRKLTPLECERLQTVPDNFTNHVSNSQRYKMLGNGWTVDVIAHIFRRLK